MAKLGLYKLREWVWTETGKGDRWEGDRRVGPSPPSEWPAPPHSLHQPALHGKRPANFICWLLFTTRPVPVGSSAGCVCLQRPCSAGFVCLPTFAMPCLLPMFTSPRSVLHFPAPCSLPCAPGSSCKLQELPCWQLQHGPAVAARAPVLTFTFFLQSP